MRIGWLIGIAGVAALAGLGASSEAARAELRVMESNATSIEVDAVFADDATFDVPAGKKIKLLKSPASTTHEIAGPYNGTLDAYKPACGMWDRVTGKCAPNNAVTGGSRSISGATRGLKLPPKE
jgi:hypothetical protein